MKDEDEAVTGEFETVEEASPLVYAENPDPETIWRCQKGHEVRTKSPAASEAVFSTALYRPPSMRFSITPGGPWFDTGPICYECACAFIKDTFKMEPVA